MIDEETASVREELEALEAAITASGAVFFPIRHHSPACAHHLRELLRTLRPKSVLVEGPRSFDALLPLVLHEKARPPFAIYTSFSEGKRGRRPPRYAGFYPFCDYSPELVAIREVQRLGARLRFIDLDFADQVFAERGDPEEPRAFRVQSLQAESLFESSAFVRSLARKLGCRDHDDLWDHLFEADPRRLETDAFVARLTAYCLTARLACPKELLESNGTLARERAMAAAIREELDRPERPIVVVTGGFHTVNLPHLLKEPSSAASATEARDTETVLMRYSFEQLDALNGYAAGMPSPHYYQRLWELLEAGDPDPFGECAARLLVEVGGLTRESRDNSLLALSPSDEIAALEQARRLASLRGHAGPTREDVLDAIRGTFVKGEIASDGASLLALVRKVLAGREVGEVPPEAGVPALVLDFRKKCAELRLAVDDTERREKALDLYRKASHRATSRFFHCMSFLGSPFAQLLDGPDFLHGIGLDLLNEHWEYGWSPNVESGLIDRSVYGTTVEEAAVSRLSEKVAELEEEGRARSASEATSLLSNACRMGLHDHLREMLRVVESHVAEDASFDSVVTALSQLELLSRSQEPLEAHRLEAIPRLAESAYRRACYLVPELASAPEDRESENLFALSALREALSREDSILDRDLFLDALERLSARPDGAPAMIGGGAGVLFTEGRLDQEALSALTRGHLARASKGARARASFLRGLLATCRDAAWRVPVLLETLDELMSGWEEDDFLHGLPELRLAFSSFTPREIDRLAERVASLHGEKDLGDLTETDVSEAELALNLRISQVVAESLAESRLAEWIARKAES